MPEAKEKTNPQNSNELEKWEKIASLIGKVIFALGSTSYVLGILITNISIGRFGPPVVSLVKANYFLTGVWGLLPIYFSIFVIGVILLICKSSWSIPKKVLVSIMSLVILRFLVGSIKVLLIEFLEIKVGINWWILMLFSFLVSGAVISYFLIDWLFYETVKPQKGREELLYRLIIANATLFIFIIFIVFYVYVFAWGIYPEIPFFLGGAKPVKVQIYVDPNSEINSSFEKCKLSQISQGVWGGKLIIEADNDYFFAVPDTKEALCVKKQDIKAIKYSPELFFEGGGGKFRGKGTSGSFE
jgi:hypothetical protein